MAAQRGIIDDDPGRIERARHRKRLTRASLALAINGRLGRGIATRTTIAKIENGTPVERTRYLPVLIQLDLAPEPSLKRPRPKQAPGEWVRELREAHGIQPTDFCRRAKYFDSKQRLSRSMLDAIETGRRRIPSWKMVDAIATGFEGSHVDIDIERLEAAWILHGGAAAVREWGPEIIDRREKEWIRLLEEEPERMADLAKALELLATAAQLAVRPSPDATPAARHVDMPEPETSQDDRDHDVLSSVSDQLS